MVSKRISRWMSTLTLAALLVVAISGCGGEAATPTPAAGGTTNTPAATGSTGGSGSVLDQMGHMTPSKGDGKLHHVALIVAQGGLGDQSYNDLAYAGLQAAAHDYTNLVVQPIQSADIVAQGQSLLQQAATNKFDLVINLEFSLSDALGKVAPTFPDTQFAMVNLEVKQPNVTSILFQEQEGSYLAGALAAMVTADTSIKGPALNPDKVIGAIGGAKSTGIDKFLVGYQQGAQDVDKSTKVLVSYANNFGDPAKGKELTDAQYSQGADIVYQVAGGTGAGVIQAAKAANKFAIGVDSDQDFLAPGNVLTSMIKHTDLAVYELCRDIANGSLKGGSTRLYDLKNGGVDISPMKYTKDIVPQADLDKVASLKQDIISGKIKVWNVIDQGYPDWFSAK